MSRNSLGADCAGYGYKALLFVSPQNYDGGFILLWLAEIEPRPIMAPCSFIDWQWDT